MTQYRIDRLEVTMNDSLMRVSAKRYTLKPFEPLVTPTAPVKKAPTVKAPTVGSHIRGREAEVLQLVKQIVAEQLGINDNDLNTDSRFVQDLGADSLDTVELIMALEDELDIEVCDEDAENLINIGDVLKYLTGRGIGQG